MDSKLILKSVEEKRLKALKEAKKKVLTDRELELLNADDKELISLYDSLMDRDTWHTDRLKLQDPVEYNKTEKKLVADFAGLFAGAEVLTDAADSVSRNQNLEIEALERYTATLEADVAAAELLVRGSKAGPELWKISWGEDEDPTYISNEENSLEETSPPPAEFNQESGNLTLDVIASTEVYGRKSKGYLRLMGIAGGDLVTPHESTVQPFSFFNTILHTKSKFIPTSGSIPWVPPTNNGLVARYRVDIPSPSIFSRVSISAGSKFLAAPYALYWYPFGNEGLENVIPDLNFEETYTSDTNAWEFIGSGVSCIYASGSTGPDPTIRLDTFPAEGDTAKLLVLSPGSAEIADGSVKYTDACGAFQTVTDDLFESGGALRLAVKWRGLGKFISGEDIFVTVEFYGDNTSEEANDLDKLRYSDRFSMKQGLTSPDVPAAGEFSLSRFLVFCPENTIYAKVILSCTRPKGESDPLNTSLVEFAFVSMDGFAGNFTDWTPPIDGQPGAYPSYVGNIPLQPEAVFFEFVVSQDAYEKEPDSKGYYGNEYDLSLRDILIENIEYSRSGRWISKSYRFIGEPRRFQLILPEGYESDNVEFKLALRQNEKAYTLTEDEPIQIVSTEESSLAFNNSNTIVYSVQDKTEIFNGTDLAGRVKLTYYPYVSKSNVLTITNTLTRNGQKLEFDPNATDPLVIVE